MIRYIECGVCGGEWKSALETHEFTVMFFERPQANPTIDAGQWAFVEILEYGEVITLFPVDARKYMPAETVAEVEAAIAGYIGGMEDGA